MLIQDRVAPGRNLIRALREGRRGWWRRAVADALFVSLVAGAVAAVAAWVSSWLAGRAGPALGGLGLRPVLVAAAGGLSAGLAAAALRSPSLLDVARRVDRLLGQSERFSTAFEVLEGGGPSNVVARALVAEVEERAARLDAALAGWARRRDGLGKAAAFATLLAAAVMVMPVPARGVVGGTGAPALAAAARARDAVTLAGIAELLDLVGEQEDSDYLRALAASFTDLSARVSSRAVSAAEADMVAQELAEHLQVAAQDVGGAFAAAVEAAFAPEVGRAAMGSNAPGSEATRSGRSGGAAEEPAAASRGGADDPSASYYRSYDFLMERFEADPTSVGVRPQRQAGSTVAGDASFYGGVLNADTDPNATPSQQTALGRSEGRAGGAPAGAAERSSDAAGDGAGQGGSDLGALSDAFLDLPAQGVEAAALPRNQREDGEFVEMELVPLSDAGAASATVPASVAPAFVRSEEAAFAFRGIGPEHAVVVSRYFTPDAAPGDRSR